MPSRNEYSTVTDIRSAILAQTGTVDDALLLFYIRQASRDMEDISLSSFAPVIMTRYFDAPVAGGAWSQLMEWRYTLNTKILGARELVLDADLLELTTLTNGDGTTIAASNYVLEPYNRAAKNKVSLLRSSSVTFLPTAASDYQKALSILGMWGYHEDYINAWVDSTTTIAAAITTAAQTTFTSSAGAALKAGWMVRIDSEYLYVVSISSNTVTVQRGVNGSTAATHLISTVVYYWEVMFQIQGICAQAATLYYNIRNNPGVSMIVDGHVISKPSDVRAFITESMNYLGLNRESFA